MRLAVLIILWIATVAFSAVPRVRVQGDLLGGTGTAPRSASITIIPSDAYTVNDTVTGAADAHNINKTATTIQVPDASAVDFYIVPNIGSGATPSGTHWIATITVNGKTYTQNWQVTYTLATVRLSSIVVTTPIVATIDYVPNTGGDFVGRVRFLELPSFNVSPLSLPPDEAGEQGDFGYDLDTNSPVYHDGVSWVHWSGTGLTAVQHDNTLSGDGTGGTPLSVNTANVTHGDLAGLSSDDHPQYILVTGTRAFTGDQSFAGYQAKYLRTHNVTSGEVAAPSSGNKGQQFFDSDNNRWGFSNGTVNVSATASGGPHAIIITDVNGKLPIGSIPTGTDGSSVPFGNDARFSDARTPTAHAASHLPGASDALTASYLPKDGSVTMTGSLNLGGNALLNGTHTDITSDGVYLGKFQGLSTLGLSWTTGGVTGTFQPSGDVGATSQGYLSSSVGAVRVRDSQGLALEAADQSSNATMTMIPGNTINVTGSLNITANVSANAMSTTGAIQSGGHLSGASLYVAGAGAFGGAITGASLVAVGGVTAGTTVTGTNIVGNIYSGAAPAGHVATSQGDGTTIFSAPTGSGAAGVEVKLNGVTIANTATTINFTTNISASAVGQTVTVEAEGGGSGSGFSGVGAEKGLEVVSNISNNKVWVSADFLTLTDGSTALTFPTVSVTADVTASVGANGPDAGGVDVSDTWVAVWAIGKADGTFALLLSLSFTSPTMPSGYTYKLLVSALRNNSSSNFFKLHQFGKVALLEDVLTLGTVVNAGTATTPTDVSFASWAPPPSRIGLVYVSGHDATVRDKITGARWLEAFVSTSLAVISVQGRVGLDADRKFQYKTDGSPADIYPMGFVMP